MNFNKILETILEVQQSRSRYQIENFVIGQHPTSEMQFYQVCIELQDMMYRLEMATLERELILQEKAGLEASEDPKDQIELKKLILNLRQLDFSIFGAQREFEILLDIWNSFEIKYSREQIEAAQGHYWETRLLEQAKLQAIGQGFVDSSNMQSLNQIQKLESLIENLKNMAATKQEALDAD